MMFLISCKVNYFIKKHSKQLISVLCILAIIIASPFIVRSVNAALLEASGIYTKAFEYCVAESGHKIIGKTAGI